VHCTLCIFLRPRLKLTLLKSFSLRKIVYHLYRFSKKPKYCMSLVILKEASNVLNYIINNSFFCYIFKVIFCEKVEEYISLITFLRLL